MNSSELYFLPTPNWFTSRPLDIFYSNDDDDGLLALSVIGSIYLFDYKLKKYYNCIKSAHLKRINCLAFKKSKFENGACLLASCSDDLSVKVWNVANKSLLKEHQLHLNTPTCLDWVEIEKSDDLVLISGDVKGNVFKWNMNTSQHIRYFPENKPITQIKCCRNKPLVAVGYKHGSIVILSISSDDQMKTLYKLKSHEDAINYLFWYPNSADESQSYEFNDITDMSLVLCSSSEDKKIKLWSIESGVEIKSIAAPNSSNPARGGNQMKSAKINFTPLCWPTSRYILSASYSGDLFVYDLNETHNQTKRWSMVAALKGDKAHKKVIYDISYFNDTIITLSLDKLINLWSLKGFSQENSLNTLNGYIYSIINSPIDPSIHAISVGDSTIKVFNESRSEEKNVKTYSNNIKTEVTQIAWHPVRETILAFGTKDGKVGIIDISTTNKPAQYLYSNYNQSVYTLIWSLPLIPVDEKNDPKNAHVIYSVADGKIMQHSAVFSQKSETVNFYDSIRTRVASGVADCGLTELAIFDDSSSSESVYFAIGKFDGSIELYKLNRRRDGHMVKLCTFLNHNKLITIIKWNKNGSYMASGSNDYNVVIVDFKAFVEGLAENTVNLQLINKYKHKLVGHRERITGLSWSVHDERLLASCSYDSTVQVWDAVNGVAIANYRGHGDKALCCLFSSCDRNRVFSGGEDYALHGWLIDQQPYKLPPEQCSVLLGKKKKQFFKKGGSKRADESTKASILKDEEEEGEEIIMTVDEDQTEVLSREEPKRTTAAAIPQITATKKAAVADTSSNMSIKIKDYKQILPLSTKAHRLSKTKSLIDCLALLETIYENANITNFEEQFELIDLNFNLNNNNYSNDEKQFLNLYLFGNRKSTVKLLDFELEELSSTTSLAWIFDVWKGNIEKLMHDLQSNVLINDFFFTLYQISITPTIYQDNIFFETYLNQLLKSNEFHKVALYYCASCKIREAIDLYLDNNQFQFALCLSQLRLNKTLANDNELFRSVLLKYAQYSSLNGDYETAVLAYTRIRDLTSASRALMRRTAANDEQTVLINNLTNKFSKYDPSILVNNSVTTIENEQSILND